MPLLFTRSPSPQLLLIPPFAESAKDGAPDLSGYSARRASTGLTEVARRAGRKVEINLEQATQKLR